MITGAGCSNFSGDAEDDAEKSNEANTEKVKEDAIDNTENQVTIKASEQATPDDLPDLQLQVTKVDEAQGFTIENDDMYSRLNEVVKADPKAGFPNDFGVFPRELVYNENGGISILFLGVNRLSSPIQSINFELTFGNQNGDYIFERKPVTLTEEIFGTISRDSAVPFLLDINPEDVEIFKGLTEDNADIRLDNTEVEIVD